MGTANFDTIMHGLLFRLLIYGSVAILLAFVYKRIKTHFTGGSVRSSGSHKINRGISGSGLKQSKTAKGFIFGNRGRKHVYLDNASEGHIAIFGGSGKGKTTALLIPSLRAWDSPFFTIDISGDISKNVPETKERIVISPAEPSKSVIYNVFFAVDSEEKYAEKLKKLEQLCNLIIDIPEKSNDTQRYFLGTARKIFLSCLIAFYDIGMDFTDICKTVFFNDVSTLNKMVEATGNELAQGYMYPLTLENEKNIGGSKSTLNDKIKIFADNENIQKICRRPRALESGEYEQAFYPDLLENSQVFLIVPDEEQEYYQIFLHIVTGQILEYISGRKYDRKKDKRILIALDEFASLGYFEILAPFRKFRKNGANICILTQSLADIDLIYSEGERKVIMDNSQYIVVLSANDNGTREYFSNLVGKEEKERVTKNSSGGKSVSKENDFAIKPEEWRTYKKHLILIHPAGYVKLLKNYYFK